MTTISFEFKEDREFFTKLLCSEDECVEKYDELFDFRDPNKKRKEFNALRNRLLEQLMTVYGMNCQLGFTDICDLSSGITADHVIPLSSNKLNKEIRGLRSEPGKKVKTQSFGSNHLNNLVIACRNCNNHKKHKVMDGGQLKSILRLKYG